MTIDQLTLVFLVGVFVLAEVYRAGRASRGVIVSVESDPTGLLELPTMIVRVRLRDGNEVSAGLSCCTACLGRLRVGDEVRVTSSRDGYIVDLPWLR
jgi:hypothetical protein